VQRYEAFFILQKFFKLFSSFFSSLSGVCCGLYSFSSTYSLPLNLPFLRMQTPALLPIMSVNSLSVLAAAKVFFFSYSPKLLTGFFKTFIPNKPLLSRSPLSFFPLKAAAKKYLLSEPS